MRELNNAFNCDDDVIDITPEKKEVVERKMHAVQKSEKQKQVIQTDYDSSRHNLYELLSSGEDALTHALDVAKQSEHPRAFEVVGNLIKQLADINHQLLDLSEKRQKLLDDKEKTDTKTTVNAVFVGSTNQLGDMIKNAVEKKYNATD